MRWVDSFRSGPGKGQLLAPMGCPSILAIDYRTFIRRLGRLASETAASQSHFSTIEWYSALATKVAARRYPLDYGNSAKQ